MIGSTFAFVQPSEKTLLQIVQLAAGELTEGVHGLSEINGEHGIDFELLQLLQITRPLAGVDLQVEVLLAVLLLGGDLQRDVVGKCNAQNLRIGHRPVELVVDLLSGLELRNVLVLEDQVGCLRLIGSYRAHDVGPQCEGESHDDPAQTIEPHSYASFLVVVATLCNVIAITRARFTSGTTRP